MPAAVSVLIVSFNSGEHLAHTLTKLVGPDVEPGPDVEVRVWDNGSGDATPLVLERYAGRITVLGDGRNYGYAHAVNGLVATATGDWLLLINGDVVVSRGKLAEMIAAAESLPQPCLVGFGQMNENGTPQLTWGDRPRLASESERRSRTRAYRRGQGAWPAPSPLEVDWISGSLVFGSCDAWRRAGDWNEEYFLYFEDTEFCLAARRAGVKIFYHGGVRVLHGHGVSMNTRPAIARAAYRHAQRLFWSRHGSAWEKTMVRFYVAAWRTAWRLRLTPLGGPMARAYAQLQQRRPGDPLDQ